MVLDDWAHWNKLTLDFIQPGRPTDNAFIEALNSRFRQGCLDERWLLSMMDTQEKVDVWKRDYDSRRPDSSLGNTTPEDFVRGQENTESGQASPDGGSQLIVNKESGPLGNISTNQIPELYVRLDAGD